ncbi:helix-turn-helix domain-containing protein [Selenomonas montiformis]|uniref:helix-turn-helix domain-containing protein n=1 Tax=Selenomonas montiformis TaxID=2652285 RepID=UPI003F897626
MAITLKAARVNVGLNQRQAAERLGISLASLQNYEAGRKYPNVLVLKRIEKLYGVPYAELIFFARESCLKHNIERRTT